ncbi:MAG TPA: PspC domain-containing protein [Candidatus Paceibacterota bacterium]|nr:PspC domain-containing protein [Candidatus Paceibacterota bacterium]
MKKLYRSEKDKTIGGIIGGLGEYFETDSTLLRVITLFTIFITGFIPGLIAYLIGLLIVPKQPPVGDKQS